LVEGIPSEQQNIGANRPRAAVLDAFFCPKPGRTEIELANISGWNGSKESYGA
jgi:hypothetical protein